MSATLAGYTSACTPERVGGDLARALAVLLCRGLKHPVGPDGSCPACLATGRVLAPPVGRALFACRRGERPGAGYHWRPLTTGDYEVIGRSLDLLEALAGTRPTSDV